MSAEAFAEMLFPVKGLDVSGEFGAQLPGTTVLGENVRAYEALTGRGRGGSRPGLDKYVAQQIPEGATLIQHLNFIVDPSTAALATGFDPLDGAIVPTPFGFPFGGTGIPFLVPATQPVASGGIPDPSTNNDIDGLGPRNPSGRRVREGGSGLTQNRHVYSAPLPARRTCLWFQLQTSTDVLGRTGPDLHANWWNIATFGGVCVSPKPGAPSLTWRIRVYHVGVGDEDFSADEQEITGVTEVASGDIGIALPDDLLIFDYVTDPTLPTGFYKLGDLTVLEVQGFPAGQYPPDLKTVLYSRFQCQYASDYNVP